jgi:hypothetical protein
MLLLLRCAGGDRQNHCRKRGVKVEQRHKECYGHHNQQHAQLCGSQAHNSSGERVLLHPIGLLQHEKFDLADIIWLLSSQLLRC